MGDGELPPDECIELALWEKFGWGPNETDRLTSLHLKRIFLILEQERVSRNAIEDLGKPDNQRFEAKKSEEAAAALQKIQQQNKQN